MTKSKQEWEKKARKALKEKMLYYPAKPILDDQIDGLRPIVEEVIQKTREEERQRVVETLKKLGIVDEETGTITFSYNELFDLFKDFPSDKETIPEGYIINPVEDGVAKYIKKKLEIKKWDKELCKIGKVVKEGE